MAETIYEDRKPIFIEKCIQSRLARCAIFRARHPKLFRMTEKLCSAKTEIKIIITTF